MVDRIADIWGTRTSSADRDERAHHDGVGPRVQDLQDLQLLAYLVDTTYTLVKQAAAALRDEELLGVIRDCEGRTATRIAWIGTRLKQAAPRALVVAA